MHILNLDISYLYEMRSEAFKSYLDKVLQRQRIYSITKETTFKEKINWNKKEEEEAFQKVLLGLKPRAPRFTFFVCLINNSSECLNEVPINYLLRWYLWLDTFVFRFLVEHIAGPAIDLLCVLRPRICPPQGRR